MTAFVPSRRAFIGGSGLVLGMMLPAKGRAAQGPAPTRFQPNAFVRIAPDNTVTVIQKHIEMGQGPSTGTTTVVADELDADWSQMRSEFSPANDPLYKNLAFGTMGTGGSSAIKESWMQMRTAGATARAMLVSAAAKRWGVPERAVSVSRGVVSSGPRRATFGELAVEAASLPVPNDVALKTPDKFTLIGRDLPKIDSRTKTDGTAGFTMDVRRPGMVHSAILRPPAFGGSVKEVNDAAARAVPGVIDVQTVPRGVVVYARDTWSAMRGRAALAVDWDFAKAERRSSEAMFADYARAVATPGREVHRNGDAVAALASSARTIDETFKFPFLAHAPMEPLDHVIEVMNGRADVWAGSQFQVGEMTAIAAVLGVPFDRVTLHQQFAGGSFGRRATPDMGDGVEAAMACKAYGFKAPVKHVASREGDITGGRYRPLTLHRVRAGLDAAGNIAAWDQVVAAQSFFIGTPMEPMAVKDGIDGSMTEGTEDDYAFPAMRVGQHIMANGVPTLWWRSVGHTTTAFVKEVLVDELLEAGGKDAIAGRLAMMKDDRLKGVLRKVVEIAGRTKAPAGRARGVAVHKSFDSYVAQIAEVSKGADGLPKVHRVWCAVDCGTPVNPNVIRQQMEGGIGFGLGHALYAEITLGENGRVEQSNFDTYRSLRMAEMPDVEVAIIPSAEKPSGVGEPGVPPIAPAVANAWRRLTGRKVRRLPFAHPENRA
ncbi:xanthine dehydrogenase family protein molybdopterin-binding subunit [Sphingomonas sp.]|uniref:xanthine dehydrogenase family protein molybdopterin-binding subunit n=1 Tax=Sphingomonas sp. TaxID=28214 RepID=UPI002DD64376|nr:xanthine dehydrogenase family protein molybdopterin-binding subunit [Sphingomonas sp.]